MRGSGSWRKCKSKDRYESERPRDNTKPEAGAARVAGRWVGPRGAAEQVVAGPPLFLPWPSSCLQGTLKEHHDL